MYFLFPKSHFLGLPCEPLSKKLILHDSVRPPFLPLAKITPQHTQTFALPLLPKFRHLWWVSSFVQGNFCYNQKTVLPVTHSHLAPTRKYEMTVVFPPRHLLYQWFNRPLNTPKLTLTFLHQNCAILGGYPHLFRVFSQ